jgi:hypothetical protein
MIVLSSGSMNLELFQVRVTMEIVGFVTGPQEIPRLAQNRKAAS